MITTLAPIPHRTNEFLLTVYNDTLDYVFVEVNGEQLSILEANENLNWSPLEKEQYDSDITGRHFEFAFKEENKQVSNSDVQFIGSFYETTHMRGLLTGAALNYIVKIEELYAFNQTLPDILLVRYKRVFRENQIRLESNWVEIDLTKLKRLVSPVKTIPNKLKIPSTPPILNLPPIPVLEGRPSPTLSPLVETEGVSVRELIPDTSHGGLLGSLLGDLSTEPSEEPNLAEEENTIKNEIFKSEENATETVPSLESTLNSGVLFVANNLYQAMNEFNEASQGEFLYASVGKKIKAAVRIINPNGHHIEGNGDRYDVSLIEETETLDLIRELKESMALEDKGSWLEIYVRVRSDGDIHTSFNYDQIPQWSDFFEATDYKIEQQSFPRSMDNQPDWFQEKLAE